MDYSSVKLLPKLLKSADEDGLVRTFAFPDRIYLDAKMLGFIDKDCFITDKGYNYLRSI